MHNSLAGHNGFEKTIANFDSKGESSWLHRREHVKRFIQECPICQKLDQRSVKINAHAFTTAAMEPMDTLNIDAIGPVHVDNHGYTHILVFICCF